MLSLGYGNAALAVMALLMINGPVIADRVSHRRARQEAALWETLRSTDPARQATADRLEARIRQWSINSQFIRVDRLITRGLTFGLTSVWLGMLGEAWSATRPETTLLGQPVARLADSSSWVGTALILGLAAIFCLVRAYRSHLHSKA